MTTINETSLSKMKTLQFNDKMTTLNKDFLKTLRHWYEQCPHYDFSTTVKSYITHVEKLEQLYGLNKPAQDENILVQNKVTKEITPEKGERKIAKARRRLNDPSKLNDSVTVSTPSGAPPRFSLGGNVSAIGPVDTPIAAAGEPTSAPGGRKRIIRGGGPTGGSESVHFRGSDAAANSISVPPVTIQLPKPTAGFWDKHKDISHTGTMPVFNLIKPAEEVSPPGKEKSEATETLIPVSSTTKAAEEAKKEEKPAAQKDLLTVPKPAFTFGDFNKPVDSSVFTTFPKFGEIPKSNDSKPVLTSGDSGSTNPFIFGKSAPLTFGAPPATTTTEDNNEEEGEYVPPKAEVVENEEPGATYSVKCALFKMVDKKFDKMGVGMLHLKEVDGKKSVLVRAATAIGTVWLNALINPTMKVAKAGDEKGEKLKIIVPLSASEMGIFLIRFPNKAAAEKVQHHIESNNQ